MDFVCRELVSRGEETCIVEKGISISVLSVGESAAEALLALYLLWWFQVKRQL